ncbi:hypothetical protein D9M70_634140 [compost metagenome]
MWIHPFVGVVVGSFTDLQAHAVEFALTEGEHLAFAAPAVLRVVGFPPRVVRRQHQAVPGQMLRARGLAVAVAVHPVWPGCLHALHLPVTAGLVGLTQVGLVDHLGTPAGGAVE